MQNSPITGLDWQILELFQQDGRITISEIAQQLGRSRSNISERIEKLQDSGVISGFSVEVNPEKMGFGINAFVRLTASSHNHRDIIKQLTTVPEVAECHVLTGSELVIMRVIARDMSHLRTVVDSFTQLGSTQTDVIFSTLQQKLTINDKLRKIVS